MSLKSHLELVILAKLLSVAVEKLEAAHLGQKLDAELDNKFGSERSEKIQQQMVKWLRTVATELEEA